MRWRTNEHSVAVNAAIDRVFKEVVLWGEAKWWPKDCMMGFIRSGNSEIKVGTRYRMKVALPFGPGWDAQVSDLAPNSKISREFLNGMFVGFEAVSVKAIDLKTAEILYSMQYQLRNWWDRLFWAICGERLHNRNIVMILNSLKKFIENQGTDERR